MAIKTVSYEVNGADAGRVDALLAKLLGYPRSRVRGLIDHEGIFINGEDCRDCGTQVASGDRLKLKYDPQRKYREKPPERKPQGLNIVYSDEHLVVVNKEAGILTVPTDRRESHTLVGMLSRYLAAGRYRAPKVSVIHRLDRDTSGLLVFAQHPRIAADVIKQFAAHKPERSYDAIVAGHLAENQGTIRTRLSSDQSLTQRSGPVGELAVTHYKVVSRFADTTLIAVNLETGKRNQIRAQFSELGHPILGDSRYEATIAAHRSWPYKRLALHARVLGFTHPVSGRPLRFEAELPPEFKKFMQNQDRSAPN